MVNYIANVELLPHDYLDPEITLDDNWNNYDIVINDYHVENRDSNNIVFECEGDAWYYWTTEFGRAITNGVTLGIQVQDSYHVYEWYYESNNNWNYKWNVLWDETWQSELDDPVHWKYKNFTYQDPRTLTRWKLTIWSKNNLIPATIWEIQIKIDDVLVADLKPCYDTDWVQCFYDDVRWRYFYLNNYKITNSMIKTVVMTWHWQVLPIQDGIDKDKIQNRIIEINKYDDWYAAKYDEISISADEDNLEWIEVSDYTIENQTNQWWVADFIELKPRWTLVLPRNRQISALNRPLVKGHKWDLLRIVVR